VIPNLGFEPGHLGVSEKSLMAENGRYPTVLDKIQVKDCEIN
jgi:hypothetical protein